MAHEETFQRWTMQLEAMNNYQPDRTQCDRFQSLGLSVVESVILTTQLEVEEVWNIADSLEMISRHPEAIKLEVLAEAIAYRRARKS